MRATISSSIATIAVSAIAPRSKHQPDGLVSEPVRSIPTIVARSAAVPRKIDWKVFSCLSSREADGSSAVGNAHPATE